MGGVVAGAHQDFDATIDTGFTGFLSMPMVRAFPLGLVLRGTVLVTLADGSTSSKLATAGSVTLGTQTEWGIILLEWSSDQLLLGMDFLKKFKKTLVVSPGGNTVTLEDDPVIPAAPPVAPAPPTP